LLLCLAPVLAACGDDEKDSGEAASNKEVITAPEESSSGGACKQVEAPQPKEDGGEKKPKGKLDASKEWGLTVETNCGSFTIQLDVENAPNTSASLVSLAKKGFYDGTTFHRIVPGFVIQGGDPTGTGQGGPGYSTVDKPKGAASYAKGVVAMAKTGTEPPGTAGSQFFVVTGQDAGLPPDYAVVGKVTKGLDVVDKIGQLGDPATEQPTQPVVISKVAVEEK
jgi:cyclophilin family peptidyl-prolyl cis-trans isomerase